MKTEKEDIISQNKAFLWLALITGLILLVPLALMQVSDGANWNLFDFIVAGVLIFGAGSVFIFLGRLFPKRRIIFGIIVALVLIWLWAELAVGLFTNWGS